MASDSARLELPATSLIAPLFAAIAHGLRCARQGDNKPFAVRQYVLAGLSRRFFRRLTGIAQPPQRAADRASCSAAVGAAAERGRRCGLAGGSGSGDAAMAVDASGSSGPPGLPR